MFSGGIGTLNKWRKKEQMSHAATLLKGNANLLDLLPATLIHFQKNLIPVPLKYWSHAKYRVET
jgi:hypothetical protein